MFYMEYLIVVRRAAKYAVQVLAVGVGNEDLSELVARHQSDYLLYTLSV